MRIELQAHIELHNMMLVKIGRGWIEYRTSPFVLYSDRANLPSGPISHFVLIEHNERFKLKVYLK